VTPSAAEARPWRSPPGWACALVALSAAAITLAGCGSARTTSTTSASLPTRSAAAVPATTHTQARPASVRTIAQAQAARTSINATVVRAKAIYRNETKGAKLPQQLARIAGDGTLLHALGMGDLARARAAADKQLRIPLNHWAHVTRISVIRGSRALVNATVNSDGVFVVTPGRRVLRLHGRPLGVLLVSLQDVTGYVKLIQHITGADALVRGASGHVRTSLPAARRVRLPSSGSVMIAGRTYLTRSFREKAWGNEPLTVWILEPV
jgi:hypothetical protein